MIFCKTVAACAALTLITGFIVSPGFNTTTDENEESIGKLKRKLAPIHNKMGPTRPGDWLLSHRESGQSYAQYARSRPVRLTNKRNVLYVLPLGEFDENQMRIVKLSADFLSRYFACETKTLDTLSLDIVPADARRVHPDWGMPQIHSTYVLDNVLKPRLPADAVALIALTTSDLYPQESWNFVFGQASLRDRVGVWSIFRNGDPQSEFKTVLRRTLKTATHETGHMFSMKHCIAYECNMCGSNSRAESDRRPVYLCPECVAKVWLATDCKPLERFQRLEQFCATHGLDLEREFFNQSARAISNKLQPKK